MVIHVSKLVAKMLARYPRAESFWRGSLSPGTIVTVSVETGTVQVTAAKPS